MVIEVLPSWLKQQSLEISSCKLTLSSKVNFKNKEVQFYINAEGWLTKAKSKVASSILDSLFTTMLKLKFNKEEMAKSQGWTILSDSSSFQKEEKRYLKEAEIYNISDLANQASK